MSVLSTIETKVWAAGVGAGAGAVLGTAADWGLGVWLWHADSSAAAADAAIAAVPAPVAALVALAVTFVGAVVFGYNAPASNHAGNNATGEPMDDSDAGHDAGYGLLEMIIGCLVVLILAGILVNVIH